MLNHAETQLNSSRRRPSINRKLSESGGNYLNENNFMRVNDVARELGISKSHAYKIMQKLNNEPKEKGFLTISGRVNRKFFMEKFCYSRTERKES